ncbi:anti sigma factor C-terminal domain-containing protein [Bacillus ndiopicus]|uniref:anti sigma factor C-terminal domain-containing protein n=1 Tax=Bacillus ndiopicus TaxID=1347368 RepID=UPI0005A775CB|nr:anti sigma factor C-terminal domain-containing protein [Bacillus ndiopicus]
MEESLQKAIKKAKLRNLILIVATVFIVLLVSWVLIYRIGDVYAGKSSIKLQDEITLRHAISEPNIQISSQVSQRSIFGGTVVTNRSKNVNGYVVPWSTLTNTYGWESLNLNYNEFVPSFYLSDKSYYVYDKQTKNKVATFVHPDTKKYFTAIPNDLAAVRSMENYVAEIAISFDKPYTTEEITKMIPENLNIEWFYMTSLVQDEDTDPAGVPVYGFAGGIGSEKIYEDFMKDLAKYDISQNKDLAQADIKQNNEVIQTFLKINNGKAFKDVPVLGVMLTGQTKNFAALEGKEFVRSASVGVTVPMVPYIQPEK